MGLEVSAPVPVGVNPLMDPSDPHPKAPVKSYEEPECGKAMIAVIIPALNERESIGLVLRDLPRAIVGQVIVVDNGCADDTAAVAASAGAEVVRQPRRGYGAACLAGISALDPRTEVVVFLDGDFSDNPEQMDRLIAPILEDTAALVIGSRVKGICEAGALSLTQRFGNWLSCLMIRRLYGVTFSDLGPFRAITWEALEKLAMDDTSYGWTVQMQVRAAKHRIEIAEVPVDYRQRAGGRSKVSGTLRGIAGAGTKIIYTILKETLSL